MRGFLSLALLLASEQVNAFTLGGVAHQTRVRAQPRHAAPLAQLEGAPAAYIEFIIGVPEPCIPDVKLTRSRDGSTGVATFTFDNPSFLAAASAELGETTGARALRHPCQLLCAKRRAHPCAQACTSKTLRARSRPRRYIAAICPPRGVGKVVAVAPTPRPASLTPARAFQVTANFINGKPRIVKGVVVMTSEDEWDRFMRFMERYGKANGLGFAKA